MPLLSFPSCAFQMQETVSPWFLHAWWQSLRFSSLPQVPRMCPTQTVLFFLIQTQFFQQWQIMTNTCTSVHVQDLWTNASSQCMHGCQIRVHSHIIWIAFLWRKLRSCKMSQVSACLSRSNRHRHAWYACICWRSTGMQKHLGKINGQKIEACRNCVRLIDSNLVEGSCDELALLVCKHWWNIGGCLATCHACFASAKIDCIWRTQNAGLRWTPLDSAGLRWTLLELQEYRHLRRTQAVNKGDPGDLRDALPEWGGSSLSRDLPGRSWAH